MADPCTLYMVRGSVFVAMHPKKLPVAGSVGVPGMTLFAKNIFSLTGSLTCGIMYDALLW